MNQSSVNKNNSGGDLEYTHDINQNQNSSQVISNEQTNRPVSSLEKEKADLELLKKHEKMVSANHAGNTSDASEDRTVSSPHNNLCLRGNQVTDVEKRSDLGFGIDFEDVSGSGTKKIKVRIGKLGILASKLFGVFKHSYKGFRAWIKVNRKKIYLGIGAIGGLLFLFLLGKFLLEPSVAPTQVRVTNKTGSHITVSWVTYGKKTKGSVYISHDGKKWIPLLSQITKSEHNDYRDDDNRKFLGFSSRGRYTTHYVDIGGLEPNTKYSIRIKSGNRTYTHNSANQDISWVYTFPEVKSVRDPNPSYGLVATQNDLAAVGSLVYVKLVNQSGEESALLSAIANEEGRYTYDPSNARTTDGDLFELEGVQEIIMVNGGERGRGVQLAKDGTNKPIEDLQIYDRYGGAYSYKKSSVEKMEELELKLYGEFLGRLGGPVLARDIDDNASEVSYINRLLESSYVDQVVEVDAQIIKLAVFFVLFGTLMLNLKLLQEIIKKYAKYGLSILVIVSVLGGNGIFDFYEMVGRVKAQSVNLPEPEIILSQASCGDGVCMDWWGETSTSCPSDCGDPEPPPDPVQSCGDGSCQTGEDCNSCSEDCGPCQTAQFCGDGSCNNGEGCSTCPGDCGVCQYCGDGSCNNGEDCNSCSEDCGPCQTAQFCGDGSCNNGEGCSTCPGDCGGCQTNPATEEDDEDDYNERIWCRRFNDPYDQYGDCEEQRMIGSCSSGWYEGRCISPEQTKWCRRFGDDPYDHYAECEDKLVTGECGSGWEEGKCAQSQRVVWCRQFLIDDYEGCVEQQMTGSCGSDWHEGRCISLEERKWCKIFNDSSYGDYEGCQDKEVYGDCDSGWKEGRCIDNISQNGECEVGATVRREEDGEICT